MTKSAGNVTIWQLHGHNLVKEKKHNLRTIYETSSATVKRKAL